MRTRELLGLLHRRYLRGGIAAKRMWQRRRAMPQLREREPFKNLLCRCVCGVDVRPCELPGVLSLGRHLRRAWNHE
jgi:hypothetical protein